MRNKWLLPAGLALLIAGNSPSTLASSWNTGSSPSGLAGTGYGLGDIAHNFTAQDQFGDSVSLYDFYGKAIILDFCTIWCAACQNWSAGLNAQQATLSAAGYAGKYQVIEMLYQDFSGNASDQNDATTWTNAFGLSIPVLHTGGGSNSALDDALTGYFSAASVIPAFVVIDAEMRIAAFEIGSSFDLVSSVADVSQVPLPASLPLLLGAFGGLGGLSFLRRRHRVA